MRSSVQRAKQYRSRAEEFRAIAEDWQQPVARHALMYLADEYEMLAERLEQEPDVLEALAASAAILRRSGELAGSRPDKGLLG
jgi:hypothetical protein